MIEALAEGYSSAFRPALFVLLCGLLAVGAEWQPRQNRDLAGLATRAGVLVLAWLVGVAVYVAIPELVAASPRWLPEIAGSTGLTVAMVLLWGWWRRRSWGELVPAYATALVAVTIPHVAIVVFWNVSGHVLYATVPAGVLIAADRRFAPLALVPLGMVFARPLAGAHTWSQAVAGLLLGVAVLLALRVGGVVEPRTGAPA